jgi:hypothetical protein
MKCSSMARRTRTREKNEDLLPFGSGFRIPIPFAEINPGKNRLAKPTPQPLERRGADGAGASARSLPDRGRLTRLRCAHLRMRTERGCVGVEVTSRSGDALMGRFE